MIPLSLAEIAAITGGRISGIDAVTADALVIDGPVVTDSREESPHGLYVARIGQTQDGHRFVGAARAAGAVAALTTRDVADLPCVVVADIQAAFAALARAVVDRSPGLRVIGITGSSGKTSTKDLLGSVLASHAETVVPEGSLNSEVGVPLTVCRVRPTTRFLVVEMGARGMGHIDYLTRMAPPQIGIVLNVGLAHVGEFGSREAIARAKSELVAALPSDGVAILNADDPRVAGMASRTSARVVMVGMAERADVRAHEVTLDATGRPSFRVSTSAGTVAMSLPLHGAHHVSNALAVVAAALECGLPLSDIAAALAEARPTSRWRMELSERPDGLIVVNDAYNANPDSMRAALRALAAMGRGRRTWAVLGSMLELGEHSAAEHDAIGRLAVQLDISRLVVVGETARPIATGAQQEGSPGQVVWVPDADAAYDLLAAEVASGDVVLFKSSRDAGLRWLGERVAGAGAKGTGTVAGAGTTGAVPDGSEVPS